MSSASAASVEFTDATAASGAATGGVSIPNYTDLLSKMEYGDNTTDTNKLNAIISANPSLFELPVDAIDKYALNCSISAPVNFLYLSTIRGGRKMSSEASVGVSNGSVGGGCGGGCGCGIKGGGSCEYTGGCFTCKKGVKNITLIYSGIHIIIPKLYSKYHAEKTAKKAKTAKTAKKAKTV